MWGLKSAQALHGSHKRHCSNGYVIGADRLVCKDCTPAKQAENVCVSNGVADSRLAQALRAGPGAALFAGGAWKEPVDISCKNLYRLFSMLYSMLMHLRWLIPHAAQALHASHMRHCLQKAPGKSWHTCSARTCTACTACPWNPSSVSTSR